MIIKNWKKDFLTIPNMLSLFRLLLIPVYMVIYLRASQPAHYYIAGGILAVSCLTDMMDGKIARHFNMISTVGKILDPFADKITQFTLILCLAIRYQYLPLWIVVGLFVLKESFQLIAGILTIRKGKMLTGALLTGKISTAILFISLIILVLMPNLNKTTICAIVIVDGIFLLISFADYIRTYYKKTSMIQQLEDK
jgi:cardiolipin synthase